MSFEVLGLVNHNAIVTGGPPPATAFDPEHMVLSARMHEAAGFDRVLVANAATTPDSIPIAGFLAGQTTSLNFLLAHRPGNIQPTMAGRMLATIDRLSGGRATVHIIAGADDREVQADGAFNTKEERYRIAGEYVDVMRRIWSATEPFDYDGEFYKFRGAFASVRPDGGALPVCWGGLSGSAIDMAARHADIYAMGGDTVGGIAEVMAMAKAAEARHGRPLDYLMTINVIVAETEDAAWQRADRVLAGVLAEAAKVAPKPEDENTPAALQFQKLMARAEESDRLDKCLWQGLNRAFKGRGNNSVLVGTPDQVLDSLMDYHALGIDRFLLRGPSVVEDAQLMGRELIPMFRKAVAGAAAR